MARRYLKNALGLTAKDEIVYHLRWSIERECGRYQVSKWSWELQFDSEARLRKAIEVLSEHAGCRLFPTGDPAPQGEYSLMAAVAATALRVSDVRRGDWVFGKHYIAYSERVVRTPIVSKRA